MKFASVHFAVITLLLSYYLPGGFEFVRSVSASVQRHFCTVDGTIDLVCAPRGKAETGGIDLVEVTENFQLEFGW
jgi:hypothetical protein